MHLAKVAQFKCLIRVISELNICDHHASIHKIQILPNSIPIPTGLGLDGLADNIAFIKVGSHLETCVYEGDKKMITKPN